MRYLRKAIKPAPINRFIIVSLLGVLLLILGVIRVKGSGNDLINKELQVDCKGVKWSEHDKFKFSKEEIEQVYQKFSLYLGEENYLKKKIAYQKSQINQLKKENKALQIKKIQLSIFGVVLILSFFIIYSIYAFKKGAIMDQLKKAEATSQFLQLEAMIDGQEQERRRISRDLHDGLGTLLAVIKVRFDLLGERNTALQTEEEYKKTKEFIDLACMNIREISHAMTPSMLAELGFILGVEWLCNMFSKKNELAIIFTHYGIISSLGKTMELNIYRIIQELLKNSIEHAKAKKILVQMGLEEDCLTIIVEDDGVGFDKEITENKGGIGFQNIFTRVNYHRGKVDIQSKKGIGTTWTITFQLPKSANKLY